MTINYLSYFIVPFIIVVVLFIAIKKKINAYDAFLDGAKEGMGLVKEVFPTLLAMIAIIATLRSCGIINDLGNFLAKLFNIDKSNSELIPLILFRPISGSASISVFSSICSDYGPDSLVCKVGSVIQGSTDTTLYVLSLYFSSIGISKWKHSLKAGLIADVVGISVGVFLSILFFGF
jgi:spore maturation protein B